MRRHRSSASYGKSGTSPLSDPVSLSRTFNSDANPSRPIRPSPLTNSTIQGMPLDIFDRIRSFTLFQSAPEGFLAAIGAHLRPQLHSSHDYILTEGDDAKAMYWLVRGSVAVCSRDGESTYAELKPGAFFGEIGVLMSIPRTATIIARSKCLLVVLKKEDLAKVLPNFPEVERTIREEAQERLSILERKKREKTSSNRDASPSGAGRGEKRARDSEDVDMAMTDSNGTRPNGSFISKKRKSPSPSLVEVAASSALGSGMVNVRQLLKELPLFSGLPPEILHFLGFNARQCTYPPFTDIIQQGSQGREVYFIVRGEVEVIDEKASPQPLHGVSNGVGRSPFAQGPQVKARLRQGQYFGEVVSLSLAPRRTATVRSVSSVECLLITGEVLTEFWRRCPPAIREQIEQTAKQRLKSASDNDVVMKDITDETPPLSQLEIRDRPSKATRRGSVPIVTVENRKPETMHKPSRIEDRPVLEPVDPDPYLFVDFDNIRSKSRRSSLAPPPDTPSDPDPTDQRKPTSRINGSSLSKHLTTPPDSFIVSKRPKILSRSPTPFNKGLLPDPLIILIFSHLSLPYLMRLRRVSHHWDSLLRTSPSLLHNLDLSLYNRAITDSLLMHTICPFVGHRPRRIDISNCFHLTDDGFLALSNQCGANVRTWKMKSVWDVTSYAIIEMVKSARLLEEVDLSNCRKVNDSLLQWLIGNVPQHHAAQLSSQRSAFLSRPANSSSPSPPSVIGAQHLRSLTLSYCKHVTDRSMSHIAQYARWRLEELDLTRCTTITDHGFQAWGQALFPKLRRLVLSDCTYLTHNAVVYLSGCAKGLRELDLVSLFYFGLRGFWSSANALGTEFLLRPLRHRNRSPRPRLSALNPSQYVVLRLRRL
jgi:F-box/leucine-rich repeat protein 7